MPNILVNEATKFVTMTTFSFDMLLKETAPVLFNGLTAVLADEDQTNNPDKFAELINRREADAINATVASLYQLLESEEFCAA